MKISYLLLLLLWLPGAALRAQEAGCKDLAALHALEAAHYTQLSLFQENTFTANYDLRYHRLEWEVDPAVQYISGSVTSYFVPTADDFQEINFDLASHMQVEGVWYHHQSVPFVLLSDDRLQISLPQAIPPGQLDSVRVTYAGVPASEGFGSFRTATHQGTPVLWTLSEPFGAKEWWPCKQSLNDKIDSIDVIVRTPGAYRVASNGLLVSELTDSTHTTFHWRHRYPIAAYLVAIGVTNYSVFSDFVTLADGRELEILNYVYPESLAAAEAGLQSTIGQMALFDSLFGAYPFANEKYGHAQFGFGGGMEHQTMSFMGGFSFGLQAHELAHQWFGDKVTCGSWQDIWLNEGFATYLTGMSYEFLDSPQAWYNWKLGVISSVVSQPDGSVWVDDTTSVSRIFSGRLSYNKGAMLLHQLRWIMGHDAFFDGVRQYLHTAGVAYDYARTPELQTALEAASGLDLTAYFDQWLYGQGYPSYQIEWAPRAGGEPGLTLRISQTTSHPSVGFFDLPLPIEVRGAQQDTLLRLPHSFNGQTWEVALPFVVEEVVFDPDLWLISAANTVVEVPVITAVHHHPREAPSLSLYPNPTSGVLHLAAEASLHGHTLRLFQQNGQLVGEWPGQGPVTTLDLGKLPAGLYRLQVAGRGQSWPVFVER